MATAKTLVSSSTLFLPVSEFINRCDKRSVCQLVSDDNVPVVEGTLSADVNLLAVLGDACGLVEATVYNGGRYTKEDLELLVATDCHGRSMLYRIVHDVTMMFLFERRPELRKDETPSMKRSKVWLEELYEGKQIFGFQETVDSGHMDHHVETAQQVEDRQMTTFTLERMFGRRNNRLYG